MPSESNSSLVVPPKISIVCAIKSKVKETSSSTRTLKLVIVPGLATVALSVKKVFKRFGPGKSRAETSSPAASTSPPKIPTALPPDPKGPSCLVLPLKLKGMV